MKGFKSKKTEGTVLAKLQVDRYSLDILERGTEFKEIVEVDVDNQTEVFRVPQHNDQDAMDMMNDFNMVSVWSNTDDTGQKDVLLSKKYRLIACSEGLVNFLIVVSVVVFFVQTYIHWEIEPDLHTWRHWINEILLIII